MNDEETKARARARVNRALREIEEAQAALRRACELLCPVLGFVRQWEEVGKLHLRVKSQWHKVSARTGAVDCDLDESAKAALLGGRSI